MDNQTQPSTSPVQPIPQTPIEPSTNWFKIMTFVIFGLIISTGLVFAGIQIGKKQSKILSTENNQLANIPTTTTMKPTPFRLTIPSSTPITDDFVEESLKLNVLAMGGGIETPRYSYTFIFNKQLNDVIKITKVSDPENIRYKGATDLGFVIKHENIELQISPSFEGAGTPIENKLIPVIISNSKLATGPIFRLKEKDVMGAQNSQGGSDYTTQYSEDPEVCKVFNQSSGTSYPACISSGFQVFTKDDSALSIHCSAEDEKALWCDEIVKSLSVSVSKY